MQAQAVMKLLVVAVLKVADLAAETELETEPEEIELEPAAIEQAEVVKKRLAAVPLTIAQEPQVVKEMREAVDPIV